MAPDRPRARTEGLVIKAVADELLVYDLASHRAHSLNRVAAAVWRLCDGTRAMMAITAAVTEQVGESVPVGAARYALQSLGRAGLLAAPMTGAPVTRRDLIRQLGTAAAVTLPLVTTIAAPTAAQTASCIELNQLGCTSLADCCATPQGVSPPPASRADARPQLVERQNAPPGTASTRASRGGPGAAERCRCATAATLFQSGLGHSRAKAGRPVEG